MLGRLSLAFLAGLSIILPLPKRSCANPYGYYAPYSRTRRDPAALASQWGAGYGGEGEYGGYYPPNQYGAPDNSLVNPPPGSDSSSQRGTTGGGWHNPADLGRFGQHSSRSFSAQIGTQERTKGNPHPENTQERTRRNPHAQERTRGNPHAPEGCDEVVCQSLENCIDVSVNGTACCPTCAKYACPCQGYQVYDCQQNGFSDGMVPEGKSYTVAEGTTICSCPPGGGSITCSFHDPSSSKCPDLPPNCVEPFVRSFDGCTDCAMVGCRMETGQKVEEGMTASKPPCSTCYCPPGGGDVICGVDPACEAKIKQQVGSSLAMESSVREINSMGGESNLYGGYTSLGYGGGYGTQDSGAGSAPVIPPVVPLSGSEESETATDPKASVERQGTGGESAGYNPYGGYQQGFNGLGYQNAYGSYGQGNMGYGGNYYGYGYNGEYSQDATGYGQAGADGVKNPVSDSSSTAGDGKTGTGTFRQADGYGGYPAGGYGQYGQRPYVPSVMSAYPSFAGEGGAEKSAESSETELQKSKADAGTGTGQSGSSSQGLGYPYAGYGQGGYYQPELYGQYGQGYPFQPQVPAGDGEATAEQSSSSNPGAGSAPHKQPQQGAADQQAFAGGYGQYYSGYNGRNNIGSRSQYEHPHQHPLPDSLGADRQSAPQVTGHDDADSDVTEKDASTPSRSFRGNAGYRNLLPASDRSEHGDTIQPTFSSRNGLQRNSRYQSRSDGQSKSPNPPSMQRVVPSTDRSPPQLPRQVPRQSSRTTDRQSRKSRHNLNVINKGRFTHEKAIRAPTTTTTTTTTLKPTTLSTTRKTTTTTTSKPVTTASTTKRTTTTTTTATTTTTPESKKQGGVSFERVLAGCCARGQQWAAGHDTCLGISSSAGGIYSQICSVAQEKCCLEAKNQQFCRGGIETALSSATCDVPANLVNTCGANDFKMCCDCCEMGRKARGLGLSCDAEIFGTQCNNAFAECCRQDESELPGPKLTTLRSPRPTPSRETEAPVEPRCATDNKCQHICDDTTDGMVCSCRTGYKLHSNGRECVDVNECILNTHTCTEHQLCLNREGSFFCQRRISCGTGYELTDQNTCRDINECELGIHDCLPNSDCDNIRGSYRCIPKLCDAGYITDATGRCIDIDECRGRDYSCPKGASCVNTDGSYSCKCPVGMAPNDQNTICQDIDECKTGSANCRIGTTCLNTIGSYSCRNPPRLRCAPGYEVDKVRRTCGDIDECTSGTHTCKSGSTCINEDGGFRCQDPLVCPDGMQPDESGRICLDVNECEDASLHRCDVDGGRCLDLAKTFKCICDAGYANVLTTDGLPTCEDVDECRTASGTSCTYKCRNLPGSYECFCPEGYKLGSSGTTCEDIDECGSSSSPCADGETCFNTNGGHKCVDLSCPAGYARVSNTRCARQSCRGKPRTCLKQPKQISFYNITLTNGTMAEKPLFRMSLARNSPNSRYEFLITSGNQEGVFKVKSSTRISKPTGIVYTAREVVGPKEYVVDMTLKLVRGRRRSNFVSRLYIFVSKNDL